MNGKRFVIEKPKIIGFTNVAVGNVIRAKTIVVFHNKPDLLTLGRQFPYNTCFTILEVSEPKFSGSALKERKFAVLYENKIWYKIVDSIGFALKFEVIL